MLKKKGMKKEGRKAEMNGQRKRGRDDGKNRLEKTCFQAVKAYIADIFVASFLVVERCHVHWRASC